jgi:hypothetical protein
VGAVIDSEDHKHFTKGDVMKKFYVAALLTITCLLGFGVGARAQDIDGVVVHVPFDFVAGGANLPAGEYRISRVSSSTNRELAIQSYSNGGAFLLPIVFEGVSADQAALTFEHIGNRYFLSKVKTLGGIYSMRTPPERIALAQAKSQSTSSSSGTN